MDKVKKCNTISEGFGKHRLKNPIKGSFCNKFEVPKDTTITHVLGIENGDEIRVSYWVDQTGFIYSHSLKGV